MPKSKGVRPGKSRSRKIRNDPASIGRGVVWDGGNVPDIRTAKGAISAAFDITSFVGVRIIDDTPEAHEQPKHIRRFRG